MVSARDQTNAGSMSREHFQDASDATIFVQMAAPHAALRHSSDVASHDAPHPRTSSTSAAKTAADFSIACSQSAPERSLRSALLAAAYAGDAVQVRGA